MSEAQNVIEQMAAEIERLRQQNEDLLQLANRLAAMIHIPNPFLVDPAEGLDEERKKREGMEEVG